MAGTLNQELMFAVVPKELRAALGQYEMCIYGVSIGPVGEASELIASGFGWASRHFRRCALLLGDGPFRHTLRITEGLDEPAAALEAQRRAELQLRDVLELWRGPAEVFRFTELMRAPLFQNALGRVRQLYAENEQFRRSLDSDAESFVNRQQRRGRLALPISEAYSIGIEYLLEEIAAYLQLFEMGWKVDVYAGEPMPTLQRIIMGKIRGCPPGLADRVSITLRAAKQSIKGTA